jgi:hypothetical protein
MLSNCEEIVSYLSSDLGPVPDDPRPEAIVASHRKKTANMQGD